MAELQRSLGTREFAIARSRCLAATRWFAETMGEMRLMTTPTRGHLEAAAREFFERLTRELDHPRRFPPGDFVNRVAWNIELSEEHIADLDRQLIANDFGGDLRRTVRGGSGADVLVGNLCQLRWADRFSAATRGERGSQPLTQRWLRTGRRR